MKELIAQGAEAKLYVENGSIIKERVPKTYRLKELDDKIRKLRTRREISILKKAEGIIPVPRIKSNSSEKDFTITMEFIDGLKLADHLDKFDDKKRKAVCKLIGKQVALLHNNNIIHEDLTTSNMIFKDNELYFIDFGLSFIDSKPEHKAVDLHLLKQALESKHSSHFESSFNEVLKAYTETAGNSNEVLERLDIVEGRGRYKNKRKQ